MSSIRNKSHSFRIARALGVSAFTPDNIHNGQQTQARAAQQKATKQSKQEYQVAMVNATRQQQTPLGKRAEGVVEKEGVERKRWWRRRELRGNCWQNALVNASFFFNHVLSDAQPQFLAKFLVFRRLCVLLCKIDVDLLSAATSPNNAKTVRSRTKFPDRITGPMTQRRSARRLKQNVANKTRMHKTRARWG